jgi:hypothetical protein
MGESAGLAGPVQRAEKADSAEAIGSPAANNAPTISLNNDLI